ncbi:hypothetical protein EDL79_04020 [Ehrlichia ruminantium]|uniref:Uncharacterized protein n=1 Tax=Ehrlichia ruminantium TaxID=779 RepID=A0AAE6UKY5_EHRRU|nr:hypothetical protein [Ehrlichia ruminantium]QGR03703.1 hypothetical protein EDL80_04010 [Ehrlichia ruminantium]QGR04630.1 hypothetical protein EDL79_04020 [Ehrlichia ruminantium]
MDGDCDAVYNVSELVYNFVLPQLNLATEHLYNAHCITLENLREFYAPFFYREGALIKLASYACDVLNQYEIVRDVNVNPSTVEDLQINISRINTAYCTMLYNVASHSCSMREDLPQYIRFSVDKEEISYTEILSRIKHGFFSRKEDLLPCMELYLLQIRKLLYRIRQDCATIIKYGNFLSHGFLQVMLAVHNINFFADKMEQYLIEDIVFKCEHPKIMEFIKLWRVVTGKVLKDYFSMREPGFVQSKYIVYFKSMISKKIGLYNIADQYLSSFEEIKEKCSVTLRDMIDCVIRYDKIHNNQGKSFPDKSELLVSRNGQVKLLNKKIKRLFLQDVDNGPGEPSPKVMHATFEMNTPSVGI